MSFYFNRTDKHFISYYDSFSTLHKRFFVVTQLATIFKIFSQKPKIKSSWHLKLLRLEEFVGITSWNGRVSRSNAFPANYGHLMVMRGFCSFSLTALTLLNHSSYATLTGEGSVKTFRVQMTNTSDDVVLRDLLSRLAIVDSRSPARHYLTFDVYNFLSTQHRVKANCGSCALVFP